MSPRTIEAAILVAVLVATAIWLDLVPADLLAQALRILLAWSVFSILLVGSAGAWVALRRGAMRRSGSVAHRPGG